MCVSPVDLEPYRKIIRAFEPLEQDDLLNILGRVQKTYGYVPRDVVVDLAERLGRPAAALYGAVTFYPALRSTPEDKS